MFDTSPFEDLETWQIAREISVNVSINLKETNTNDDMRKIGRR
jgi:hypothetical protein